MSCLAVYLTFGLCGFRRTCSHIVVCQRFETGYDNTVCHIGQVYSRVNRKRPGVPVSAKSETQARAARGTLTRMRLSGPQAFAPVFGNLVKCQLRSLLGIRCIAPPALKVGHWVRFH